MKIGYIRVSTQSQNTEAQEQEVSKQDIDKWFIDKSSGRNTDRKEFLQMIDFCREGDIIYCYDFSRISRSLKDLLNIIDTLTDKGVSLVSIKENLDTSSSSGRFMVQILGAVNEYQVNLQREKIMDGIAEAKKAGKYKGRKKISIDNFEEIYNKFNNREIKTKTELAKILKISRQTLYNLIDDFEQNKKVHATTE